MINLWHALGSVITCFLIIGMAVVCFWLVEKSSESSSWWRRYGLAAIITLAMFFGRSSDYFWGTGKSIPVPVREGVYYQVSAILEENHLVATKVNNTEGGKLEFLRSPVVLKDVKVGDHIAFTRVDKDIVLLRGDLQPIKFN